MEFLERKQLTRAAVIGRGSVRVRGSDGRLHVADEQVDGSVELDGKRYDARVWELDAPLEREVSPERYHHRAEIRRYYITDDTKGALAYDGFAIGVPVAARIRRGEQLVPVTATRLGVLAVDVEEGGVHSIVELHYSVEWPQCHHNHGFWNGPHDGPTHAQFTQDDHYLKFRPWVSVTKLGTLFKAESDSGSDKDWEPPFLWSSE